MAAPGQQQRPMCTAFSAESAKVVHLVRHGQGTHNVEAALHGASAYASVALLDARLDETGRAQARALGARLREARIHVEVVLVSPLSRTIETASLMFEGSGVPLVAVEMAREAHGGHPCDQRRPISAIRREFPHVDYSLVETDEDTWHNPHRRETVRDVAIRCDKLLAILRGRPERNMVLVSHGVLLETLLNRSSLNCTDDCIKLRRFENCELRSVVLGGWGGPLVPAVIPAGGLLVPPASTPISAATPAAAAAAAAAKNAAR